MDGVGGGWVTGWVEDQVWARGRRALDEEVRRGVRVERRNRDQLLTGHTESLAARREHVHARAGGEERGHQIGDGVDDVLAVVEHHQRLLIGHRRDERTGVVAATYRAATGEPERRPDGRDDAGWLADRRELDEVHAIAEALAAPNAYSVARRVLPTPPGPTRVTSRFASARRSSISSSLASEASGQWVGKRAHATGGCRSVGSG